MVMFVERLAAKLSRAGEEFSVGGVTCRGVFRILDTGTMRNYLDDVEVMGITRPGLLLVTAADAPVDANDTISRDGRTYTVIKTSLHRIGNAAIVKVAVLS